MRQHPRVVAVVGSAAARRPEDKSGRAGHLYAEALPASCPRVLVACAVKVDACLPGIRVRGIECLMRRYCAVPGVVPGVMLGCQRDPLAADCLEAWAERHLHCHHCCVK